MPSRTLKDKPTSFIERTKFQDDVKNLLNIRITYYVRRALSTLIGFGEEPLPSLFSGAASSQ